MPPPSVFEKLTDLAEENESTATANPSHGVVIWNVSDGSRHSFLRTRGTVSESIAFTPDGKHLIVGNADGAVALWDVRLQAMVGSKRLHRAAVRSLHLTPDGRHMATGSADTTVVLCDPSALFGGGR